MKKRSSSACGISSCATRRAQGTLEMIHRKALPRGGDLSSTLGTLLHYLGLVRRVCGACDWFGFAIKLWEGFLVVFCLLEVFLLV